MVMPASALVTAHGHSPDLGGVNPEALAMWERVQKRFGRDIPITSGYRDPKRNAAAGGASRSQHMHGKALDIDVRELSREDRLRLIQIGSEEGFNGVGVYDNSLHFDTADRRAWGPDHSHGSVPDWARGIIDQHMRGGFGRVADIKFDPAKLEAARKRIRKDDPTPSEMGGGETPAGVRFDPAKLDAARARLYGKPDTPEIATPETPAIPDAGPEPAPGFFARAGEGIKTAIVGDAEYDVPELGHSFEGNRAIRAAVSPHLPNEKDLSKWMVHVGNALFAAENEQAMANIVEKVVPGSKIEADANGNLYAIIGSERFALDKSGLSDRDAMDLAKVIGLAWAASRGGNLGRALGFGGVGRVTGAGLAAGAETFAEHEISEYYGGGLGPDMWTPMIAGAFGVVGEGAATLIEKLGPKVLKALGVARSEGMTPDQAREFLVSRGIDPNEVEASVAGLVGEGQAIQRIMDAENLPVPIQLTRGQASGDPFLRTKEDIARNTELYGRDVNLEALELSADQQRRLLANADAMVSDVSTLGDKYERGVAVAKDVRAQRDASWLKVKDNYKRAKDAGDLAIRPAPVEVWAADLRRKMMRERIPDGMPITIAALNKLDEILAEGGGSVSLHRLEEWRSAVSGEIMNAKGSDKFGLPHLIRSYDTHVARVFAKSALPGGDPNIVGLWRNAVRSRAAHGRKFERQNVLHMLTKKSPDGEYKLDGSQITDYLIGARFGGRGEALKNVSLLKRTLGHDSESWAAIRSDALVKLLDFEPGLAEVGRNVSSAFVSNLKRAQERHPELLRALFTQDEIAKFRRFAGTLEAINKRIVTPGAQNTSGTGYTKLTGEAEYVERLNRAIGNLARSMGPHGMVIANGLARVLSGGANAAEAAAMRRSLRGQRPTPEAFQLPTGLGATVGATGGAAAIP